MTAAVAVAAVACFAILAATGFYASLTRRLVRQHHRERDLLVNQVCHLAGRPWQPAPSEPEWEEPERERDLLLTPSPEQTAWN